MTATRPLAYGYLRLPLHADVDNVKAYIGEARAQLAAVAQREGLALAAVYCENRASGQSVTGRSPQPRAGRELRSRTCGVPAGTEQPHAGWSGGRPELSGRGVR